MSRRARLAPFAPFAILVSLLAPGFGCATPEATFYFEQLLAPDEEKEDDVVKLVCNPDAEIGRTEVYLPSDGFSACGRVRNQLIERADEDKPQVETNTIIVYEVEVLVEKGGTEVGAFTQALSFSVPPNGTSGFFFPVMNQDIFDKLDVGDEVVAFVIARGRTTGGVNVETPEFSVPVFK